MVLRQLFSCPVRPGAWRAAIAIGLAGLIVCPVSQVRADNAQAGDISDRHVRLGVLLALSPEAIKVLQARAHEGQSAAMGLLGEAYAMAFGGLAQDDTLAALWLERAASGGQAWAGREGAFYGFRSQHEGQVVQAERALDRARARLAGLQQYGTQKDPASIEVPGADTQGTPDPDLVALAAAGLSQAQYLLACEFRLGLGAVHDDAAAAHWYLAAAGGGEPAAHAALGHLFALGEGVPRDPAASLAHYRKGADMGDDDAQAQLGALYAQGLPALLSTDMVEALKWMALSASQGNVEAREAFSSLAVMVGAPTTRAALERAAVWKPVTGGVDAP